ncbi:MAG: M23 family metallopeptidase [Thermoanaerobaculia bacterium]
MSEIRFHSGDPRRRTRSAQIDARTGLALALVIVAAGLMTVLGLAVAPGFISDLVWSADRGALRQRTERGAQAYASVTRQVRRLEVRVAADELFLARVATLVALPLSPGFPADPPADSRAAGDDLETSVQDLARRILRFEAFRRRLAKLEPLDSLELSEVPSHSPIETTSAVPIARYGPRVSPLTHRSETFTGLGLACAEGTTVSAPAGGVVLFAGSAPARAGASWRALGTVVVVEHGGQFRTLYGHLGRVLVRARQIVRRGTPLAQVGRSGWTASPQLQYEIRRLVSGHFVPVDPRLYILDTDWITAAEVRAPPPVVHDELSELHP